MLHAVLDLLLPERCAGCRHPGQLVCEECAAALHAEPHAAVPDPCPPGLPPTFAGCEYDGAVRRLLVAHKERGRHDLSGILGAALGRAVACALEATPPRGEVVIVPIPSRRASTRARGYDHALRLARESARTVAGHEVEARAVLHLVARVADQGGLDAAARAANLAGALEVRRVLPAHSTVVLVDDVMTTGSTLAEAARAVRAAGGVDVRAAVVAATRRRHASRRPTGF